MTPPPVIPSKADKSGLHLLRSAMTERTGLVVAAVTTTACVLVSLALWDPFARPSDAIREAIPAAACSGTSGAAATVCAFRAAATPLAGPLLLLLVAFIFRKALGTAVNAAKRRFPGPGSLLAAVLATVVFALSWAGSHAARPTEVGLLPQIVFPALVGFSTYAIGRWGPLAHRTLRWYFDLRDRASMKLRMLVVMAVPTGVSVWLAAGAGSSRAAYNEQLVVLVGIVVGFLIVAPRPGRGKANS